MDNSAASAGKPCIWVTRPEPQAAAHAKFLKARGFRTTISPVLNIEPLPLPSRAPKELVHYDALLATSLNAFDHLPTSWIGQLRELPLFVSGSATEKRAVELGFSNVTASGGHGSRGMPDMVLNTLATDDNKTILKLLYLAGTPRTPFLEDTLSKTHSLSVTDVYEAKLASSISEETLACIHRYGIAATTLFSSRSAMQAAHLLRTQSDGREHDTRQTILAVCISPAVERVARESGFVKTAVSTSESSESLVDKLVEQLKN